MDLDHILRTPGPLTTTRRTQLAMLRNWGAQANLAWPLCLTPAGSGRRQSAWGRPSGKRRTSYCGVFAFDPESGPLRERSGRAGSWDTDFIALTASLRRQRLDNGAIGAALREIGVTPPEPSLGLSTGRPA